MKYGALLVLIAAFILILNSEEDVAAVRTARIPAVQSACYSIPTPNVPADACTVEEKKQSIHDPSEFMVSGTVVDIEGNPIVGAEVVVDSIQPSSGEIELACDSCGAVKFDYCAAAGFAVEIPREMPVTTTRRFSSGRVEVRATTGSDGEFCITSSWGSPAWANVKVGESATQHLLAENCTIVVPTRVSLKKPFAEIFQKAFAAIFDKDIDAYIQIRNVVSDETVAQFDALFIEHPQSEDFALRCRSCAFDIASESH